LGDCRGDLGDAPKLKRAHDPVAKGKYRGMKKRNDRKKKHRERSKNEWLRMLTNNEPIKFEFWGWEETDPSPFLRIYIKFDEQIVPVNFISTIENFLYKTFNEHLQRSQVHQQEANQEIPSVN
jgi:hypothetical protein